MRKQRHDLARAEACPMEATLDLIGGKWKGVILFRLSQRMYRFNEMHRALCAITPRSLTKQLRELEADGLVDRRVFAEVPPRVEYRLTDKGKTLVPILTLMLDWGRTHVLAERASQQAPAPVTDA